MSTFRSGPSPNFIRSIPADVSLDTRSTRSEGENTHCSTTKACSLAKQSLHGGRTRPKRIIAANQRTIIFLLWSCWEGMLGRRLRVKWHTDSATGERNRAIWTPLTELAQESS